jgi:membrane protein
VEAWLRAIISRLERYPLVRILQSVIEGYQRDRISDQAAALTYYGIFSLFPLLLLFMSLAGLALQNSEEIQQQILNVVVGLLPEGQDEMAQIITGVVQAKGIAAGIGILALLWGALGWFQVIDANVNRIWGVEKPRSFVKGKLLALAMVATVGGIAMLSWMATAAVGILAAYTNVIPGSEGIWQAVVSLLSVLTIAVAFHLLYRYTPQRDIAFGDVWPAALLMAIAWEIVRRTFAFYLTQTNMISGYGPIGAVMALLFWIFVASTILLVGAELTYAIAKERRHIGPREEMEVVAAPGQQPTPKFAPQVGEGFDKPRDEPEPVKADR